MARDGGLRLVRKRERRVAETEIRQAREKKLIPKLNRSALKLAFEATDVVQGAARLAGHQLEYDARERAELALTEAQSSAFRELEAPAVHCLSAAPLPLGCACAHLTPRAHTRRSLDGPPAPARARRARAACSARA